MKPAYQQAPRRVPKVPPHLKQTAAKKAIHHKVPKATGSATPPLELYQKENCPYSHAVRETLTRLGLDYIAHSVPEGDALKHEQFARAAGPQAAQHKGQPFFIDHTHGVKLYESGAIMAYLDKTYGSPERQDFLGRIAHQADSRIRAWADPLAWQLRSPWLRARTLSISAQGAWGTVKGSFEFLRSRVRSSLHEAAAQYDEEVRATAAKPVHADVDSATEAA